MKVFPHWLVLSYYSPQPQRLKWELTSFQQLIKSLWMMVEAFLRTITLLDLQRSSWTAGDRATSSQSLDEKKFSNLLWFWDKVSLSPLHWTNGGLGVIKVASAILRKCHFYSARSNKKVISRRLSIPISQEENHYYWNGDWSSKKMNVCIQLSLKSSQ